MLWISNERASTSDFIIDKIENEMMGLQVVAVNQWNLPVVKQKVTYTLSSQRKMTILEEYVMKFAMLEMVEDADISLVSTMLGLDEVFVNACVVELCAKKMLEETVLPVIKLTNAGVEYFERGMVPDETTTEEITYYIDPKFGKSYATIVKDDNYGLYSGYETIHRSMENIKKYINRRFIVSVGKEQGKVIEHPELGKRISSFVAVKTLEKAQTLMSEIWVYDVVDSKVFCRVWDHAKGTFRQDIADFIEKHSIPDKFSVESLFKPTGIAQDIQALMSRARIASEGTTSPKKEMPIRVYRGGEIKPIFEKILELPKEQLIIFSPWINESVVDGTMLSKFKKLAKRNVQILIGWGFSNNIEDEKSSPTSKLIQELLALKNDVGIPMICMLYIGNKHEKEVVVDGEVHIAGSFNWLSYRGDYRPRGESIYYIRDSMIVKKQREYWENTCIPIAREALFKAVDPMQQIAALQFLFRTLSGDSFSRLIEIIIQKTIAEESPKLLYNSLVFCVINNEYILEAVSTVSYLLGHRDFVKKSKSILAYLKFHQPHDFKKICTSHDIQLKQEFGKNYRDLSPEDYKNILFW